MIDLALDNRVYINNDVEEALQELDLLFDTECTELLGDKDFGVSLDQFLWTLTPTTEALRDYIGEKLHQLKYLNNFRYDFDVKYYDAEYKSIYHIIIELYVDDYQKIKKEYTFK
jgi:hypothetical protein